MCKYTTSFLASPNFHDKHRINVKRPFLFAKFSKIIGFACKLTILLFAHPNQTNSCASTMMFNTAVLALLASVVSAKSFIPQGDISADSKIGARLLKHATVVEPSRHLEDNERDVSFITNYSIKYLGCSSLIQVGREGGNEDGGFLYNQNLVRFALCPSSSSCSSCSGGGEYVVSMNDFVDSYTEAKMTAEEYACEMARESCENAGTYDDDSSCYTAAGMTECIENNDDKADEFNLQEYLECRGKFPSCRSLLAIRLFATVLDCCSLVN
jgi:hypothetical protein